MIYADFYWDCPSCKHVNHEGCADEDSHYKCRECGKKFFMTFSVDVLEIERYDEENDRVTEVKMVQCEVCRDGVSWETITFDSKDMNPETSLVKPGNKLRHNGQIWLVGLDSSRNRLVSKKISA